MEGDNVSNAGFLYGAWEEGFHPILSTIKTKGLFTWSGGPRSSGVGFFCFVFPRA